MAVNRRFELWPGVGFRPISRGGAEVGTGMTSLTQGLGAGAVPRVSPPKRGGVVCPKQTSQVGKYMDRYSTCMNEWLYD